MAEFQRQHGSSQKKWLAIFDVEIGTMGWKNSIDVIQIKLNLLGLK
jgi:hypothetical protein